MGYRWYEANDVTPVFPFGYRPVVHDIRRTAVCRSHLPPTNRRTSAVLTVTYTITNTGSRQGAEASQVYLTLPAAAASRRSGWSVSRRSI